MWQTWRIWSENPITTGQLKHLNELKYGVNTTICRLTDLEIRHSDHWSFKHQWNYLVGIWWSLKLSDTLLPIPREAQNGKSKYSAALAYETIVPFVLKSTRTSDFIGIRWTSVLFMKVFHVKINVHYFLVCFLACDKKLCWTVFESLLIAHGTEGRGRRHWGKPWKRAGGFLCQLCHWLLQPVGYTCIL